MGSTCVVPHVPLSSAKRYTWLASAFRLLGHLHSSLVSWGSGTIRNFGCLSLYRSRTIIPSHGYGSASGFLVGWKGRVAYHVILGTRWCARATETCVGNRSLDINVVDPRTTYSQHGGYSSPDTHHRMAGLRYRSQWRRRHDD
jgi:hypothetical protein